MPTPKQRPIEEKYKCGCSNLDKWHGSRQLSVRVPDFIELRYNAPEREVRENVCIDVCLIPEVVSLWELGIKTTGCCCGHNKREPYIGVEEEFIPQMKELGYKVHPNELHPTREDSFYPKSILLK